MFYYTVLLNRDIGVGSRIYSSNSVCVVILMKSWYRKYEAENWESEFNVKCNLNLINEVFHNTPLNPVQSFYDLKRDIECQQQFSTSVSRMFQFPNFSLVHDVIIHTAKKQAGNYFIFWL